MELAGTVSHGTLRNSDLLSAFSDELALIVAESPNYAHEILVVEASALLAGAGEDACNHGDAAERATELVHELIDALDEHAPEGHYFGAIEGDGSDFGWWEVIE